MGEASSDGSRDPSWYLFPKPRFTGRENGVLTQPFFCARAAASAVQHRAPLKFTGAGSARAGVGLFVFVFCVLETGVLLCSPGHSNSPILLRQCALW